MTNEPEFERGRWFVFAACVFVVTLGGASESRAEGRGSSNRLFQSAVCPDVVQASIDASGLRDVECGFVEVPENYRAPRKRGDRLRIFVVVAHTHAAQPKTPVLFLTGGPGQALSGIVGQVFTNGVAGRLLAQRDVVLIDPRGAGFSHPRLTCPPPMAAPGASPSAAGDSSEDALTPAQRDAVACADALIAQGVDLAEYNTRTLARDVKSVRDGLRLPKVVIYGVSYGALLGLQTLRHAQDWVESAVLVSMPRPTGGTIVRSGPAMQEAIDAFASMCASQPACAAYGDLAANLDALLAKLDAAPIDLGVSSSGLPLQLTADLFGIFVQQALSNPLDARTLPKAVAGALGGDGSLWVPRIEAFLSQPPTDQTLFFSLPLHNSVWCSEELVIGSPEELDRRAAATSPFVQRFSRQGRGEYETCDVWPVPPAPRSFYAPFETDIPTYLISGGLDPVTTPEYAQRALRYLSNGQLTIVAAAGHLASENSPCAPELVERFLEHPYDEVDDSCTDVPVEFVP